MKQLVWLGDGQAVWQETPTPSLAGPHEALVRPLAVACCDLDVWTVNGEAPLPGPFAVGHEGIAEVLAVGDQVTTVRPGDRVVVPFQVSCGRCGPCKRGRTESCASVPLMAMYGMAPLAGRDAGGFLADAVHVPFADAMLLRLPERVDTVEATSLSDNVLDGWRCVAPYSSELEALDAADRRVLVIGHGSIGLYAAAVGIALGASVDYFDTDEAMLTVAQRLGANTIDAPLPSREVGSYPVTVSTRPDADALHASIRATWPGGVCTDAAVHFAGSVTMPLLAMYTRGLRYVIGRVSARANLPAALDLLASGRLQTAAVTDRVVPWENADRVWPQMTGKTVFVRT